MKFPTKDTLKRQWRYNYYRGDATRLLMYVEYDRITPEDFKEITGKEYGEVKQEKEKLEKESQGDNDNNEVGQEG